MELTRVATQLNFSDTGTKTLERGKMEFLSHGVGAIHPTDLSIEGEEGHNQVMDTA